MLVLTMTIQAKNGFERAGLRNVWRKMRSRCEHAWHKSYKNYGARGIRVCDRWQDFENFLADMGPRPSGQQLDRVDSNGGYEPGNVRWADKWQQARNRRTNRRLTLDGSTKPMAEWAHAAAISASLLGWRLKHGWDLRTALTTRPDPRRRPLAQRSEQC